MKDDEIKTRLDRFEAERKRYALCSKILKDLGDKLSDNVHFSPCVYITVSAHNREDLAILMTLAPKWTKTVGLNGIDYTATVDGESVQINAAGDALPGTCKLVEEEYEIPAQPATEAKPATTAKRMVLKCSEPVEASL